MDKLGANIRDHIDKLLEKWIPNSPVLRKWIFDNQIHLTTSALLILRSIDKDPDFIRLEIALPIIKNVRVNRDNVNELVLHCNTHRQRLLNSMSILKDLLNKTAMSLAQGKNMIGLLTVTEHEKQLLEIFKLTPNKWPPW